MISDADVAVRLLLAAAIGAVLGLERELKDQPAGLRTHILVCVGSCLFTLVGVYGFDPGASEPATADVTRVASQVVVGIGFIGGGTILRHRGGIRGLTTAATLWVTAAVGVAVAAGFELGALVSAGLALIALVGGKAFEHKLLRRRGEPS